MTAPTYDERQSKRHIAEAEANYKRYEMLRDEQQWGWSVVLLFYSAVHLVEAYKCLYNPEIETKEHSQRNDYVFDYLREINVFYTSLYRMSRSVRYDLFDCKERNLTFAHDDNYTQISPKQEVGGNSSLCHGKRPYL